MAAYYLGRRREYSATTVNEVVRDLLAAVDADPKADLRRGWFWDDGARRLITLNRSEAVEVADLIRHYLQTSVATEVAQFLEESGGVTFEL